MVRIFPRHFCRTLPVILLAVIFSLGACTRDQLTTAPGNSITVGLEGSPTTLDPCYTSDAYGSRILPLIYNSLVTTDHHGIIIGDLAETWQIIDSCTYLFRLKPTIRFSDGSPCRAADVKATIDFLRNPDHGCPAFGSLSLIENIDIPDQRTIIFHLSRPFASFLYALTAYIIPAPYCTIDNNNDRIIPGSGPFQLSEFSRGRRITLTRNQNSQVAPTIDTIHFQIIADDTTRILALKKGTLDLVQNAIPPYALKFLQRDPQLQIISQHGSSYKYLGYNLEDPLTGNLTVRQAISLAIDRQQIIRHILKNHARPATGLLPPEHWAKASSLPSDRYDPEAAAALLDNAGFPPLGKQGIRFSLTYKTSTNQESYEIAQIIKKQLAAIGIAVTILRFEWGTFFADIRKGNFQLYSLKWIGIEDPDIFYYIFHSSSTPPKGANRGRFVNKEADRLLEQSRLSLDPEERRRIFVRLQEILAQQVVYTNLWHRDDVVIMKRNLAGFEIYPGGVYTSLRQVTWLDT
ncbi:MAG: ABC transporter substrate-binding protein [Deltaproteobacteria bacterium]|nr:ABC transporter substrate-binding protein [Candidatus Anaeroferrophillus wilburensis]MBN2888035.1 ABC transporter substrate-binding protein [Deltaproteobacteria bacterium]